MKLKLKNYHNQFIELVVDEKNVVISEKEEAIELLKNIKDILFDLKSFVESK